MFIGFEVLLDDPPPIEFVLLFPLILEELFELLFDVLLDGWFVLLLFVLFEVLLEELFEVLLFAGLC